MNLLININQSQHSSTALLLTRLKRLLFVIVFVVSSCVLINSPFAYAQPDSDVSKKIYDEVAKQLSNLDLQVLDEYVASMENGLSQGSVRSLILTLVSGEYNNSSADFFAFVIEQVSLELSQSLGSLAIVVVVSILLGVVTKNKEGLSQSSSNVVFLACYCVIISVILLDVWQLCELSFNTVGRIRDLTSVVMPILLTVMSATGSVVSVKAYQPSVALLSGGIIEFVSSVVLPLAVCAIVISVVSNLSENIRLDKVSYFFGKISTTMLIIVFTLFTSFLTVQGISTASVDKISVKAVKFATRSYVPIIGSFLSEGFDLILAGTELIKNSLGVVALVLLLLTVISPIIRILVYALALQLVAAVVQPVANDRVVNFLSGISKNLTVLYVSIIAVAFMVTVLLMLAICTTNVI